MKTLPVFGAARFCGRGVYSILGNHEMYAGPERCRDLMRDAGFVVLDSVAVQVAPGLWIAGVPDSGRGPGTDGLEGALETALSEVGEGDAVVFLQHAPGNEDATAASGAGLMLNGHTHGGQIWPFHYMVRRAFPRIAGVHKVNGMTQVISRGAGRWGAPMLDFWDDFSADGRVEPREAGGAPSPVGSIASRMHPSANRS